MYMMYGCVPGAHWLDYRVIVCYRIYKTILCYFWGWGDARGSIATTIYREAMDVKLSPTQRLPTPHGRYVIIPPRLYINYDNNGFIKFEKKYVRYYRIFIFIYIIYISISGIHVTKQVKLNTIRILEY